MKVTLSLICLLILVGCSMDKFFLQPTTISKSTIKFKIHTEYNDSTFIVSIDTSKNYQPTFLNLNQSLINLNYEVKSVVVKSENGNSLNAWWLISDSINPKGTIVFFHGNSGSLFSQFQFILPFLKKEYNVFIFDYSGFGYSTGKAKQKDIIIDGTSIIKYVSKEINETNDIIIYGQSYGGQLAIASYLESKCINIKGIVIEGTFSSYKNIAKYNSGFFGKIFTKNAINANELVKSLNIPILVVHSEDDDIIPFSMGEEIYKNANIPKDFISINGKHCFGPILYLDEIESKMLHLFNKSYLSK